MYEIILDNRVKRDIKRLPQNVIKRFIEKLEILQSSPRPVGVKKLTSREEYRVVIGDYRVLYTISDHNKKVVIHKLKHRSEAYRH